MRTIILIILLAASVPSQAADQFGTTAYAKVLNQSRVFRHDPNYRGAEVIFKSSGRATQADAMRAWMQSKGHRALIRAGRITEIRCVGRVCVGRGR
jgi:hypothetical protein